METLFFILIIFILMIGLFFINKNEDKNEDKNGKEYMGDNAEDDLKLENNFRGDQIDYYRKKTADIYTNCEESNFIKLSNNNTKLKEVKVCDFFSGKNIKENFDSSNIRSMEASQYVEEIETCKNINESLKRNLVVGSELSDVINELRQIPEYVQIDSKDGLEDDKGCGYCWNDGDGFGEVLYGDSLGPYKNVKTGNVCANWVKPGDIKRGGGINLMNNKWRSEDDATTMKFGGNQGVINDSIKMHEQKICSQVTGCSDLDGENSICGWCFMGRNGDGKGEGMVAMVDDDGNKIGETKYKDDYCPWPGEIGEDGNPTDKWTGPNESSEWITNAAKEETALTSQQIYELDLKLQKDLKNKEAAKKNDNTLDVKTRNLAKKAMNYIENKIRYISSFEKTGDDSYGDKLYDTEDQKKIKIGDDKNNKLLYKCGDGDPILDGDEKNVYLLHNYSGLTSDQEIAIKGAYEAHEFLKKCQTNMSVMGKKINKDNDYGTENIKGKILIETCNKIQLILRKDENKKLRDIFMKLDLSKDSVGCMENCELTDDGGYMDGTKWRRRNNNCTKMTDREIEKILGYDKYNKFKEGTSVTNLNDKKPAKIIKRLPGDKFKIKYDKTKKISDVLGSKLKLPPVPEDPDASAVSPEDAAADTADAEESTNDISSFSEAMNELGDLFNKIHFPNFLSTFLKDDNNSDKNLDDRIKSLWNMFIDIARNENPGEFQGDFSLSKKSPQTKSVIDSSNQLNTYSKKDGIDGNIDKVENYEVDELSGLVQEVPDGNGGTISRKSWRKTDLANNKKGTRLLISNDQCARLNENFPCFKNWGGRKVMPSGDLMGHSEACYDELWHTQTLKDFRTDVIGVVDVSGSCYKRNEEKSGNTTFRSAMKRTQVIKGTTYELEDETINKMNYRYKDGENTYSMPITGVKTFIQNIRKVADTSEQYVPTYTDVANDHEKQKLNSAVLATNACYGELPISEDPDETVDDKLPFSCQERFVQEKYKGKYKFKRPTDCIDHFWKTRTKGKKPRARQIDKEWKDRSSWNVDNKFHKLNPDFENVWGNKYLPYDDFQGQLEYKTNNLDLGNFVKKFAKNLNDFNTFTAKEYDKYLLKKRLIYEYINEEEDKIWEDLGDKDINEGSGTPNDYKTEAEKKNEAGDKQYKPLPWVKMCWGDFKNALKDEFKIEPNIVKEKGNGTLNLEGAPALKEILLGENTRKARIVLKTNDDYKYSLKYGRHNKGGRIKLDPTYPYITEKLYYKTWFPFWRFFDKVSDGQKYYEKEKYRANEAVQYEERRKRNYPNLSFVNNKNAFCEKKPDDHRCKADVKKKAEAAADKAAAAAAAAADKARFAFKGFW